MVRAHNVNISFKTTKCARMMQKKFKLWLEV